MRKLATLTALVVVPLVAAACGSGGGGGSATPTLGNLTPVAYVKHATRQTATAPERVFMNATIDASGQQGTFNADGSFDPARHLGVMHVDVNAAGANASFDEILARTTIYMRSPLFSSRLPQGKAWLKLDLGKIGKAEGVDLSALLSQNPSQTLGQLKGLVNVKKVGTDTVNGVATTHFRGHLDVSKVPQAARLKLQNATFTPIDIWVGGDGYIRREKFGAAFVVPDGSDADLIMQIDYSDFGKAVDINLPSDSEVLDISNMNIPGLGG